MVMSDCARESVVATGLINSPRSIAPDFRAAEAIASRDKNNLYRTSLFFRDRKRYQSFCAYYAIMRVVDDRIDSLPHRSVMSWAGIAEEERVLAAWQQAVDAAYVGRKIGVDELDHPDADDLVSALLQAFIEFPAPIALWRNFFGAMRRDLTGNRFRDYEDFLDYAEGASVAPTTLYLYLLTGQPSSLGYVPPRRFDIGACGRALGRFAYIGHILRDLPQDLEAVDGGLLYLTEDDMTRHRVTTASLFEGLRIRHSDCNVRSLVRELIERARVELHAGRGLCAAIEGRIPPDCAFILRLIVRIYERVLDRIEECDWDPMQRRHYLSDAEKKAIALECTRA